MPGTSEKTIRVYCQRVEDFLEAHHKRGNEQPVLIFADPPYGLGVAQWDEGTSETIIEQTLQWLLPAYNALADGGAMYVMGAANLFLILAALRSQHPEVNVANVIIWNKNWRGPAIPGRFRYCCEYMLYLVRGRTPRHFHADRVPPDARSENWIVPPVSTSPTAERYHHCEKPVRLCERILLISSDQGDLCWDLFAGSGAFTVAARRLQRRCIAVENDPHYCKIIKERVRREVQLDV